MGELVNYVKIPEDAPLVSFGAMLDRWREVDGRGASLYHDVIYVKSDGSLDELKRCRHIRISPDRLTIEVKLRGGVRRLRLHSIVYFDGEELYV